MTEALKLSLYLLLMLTASNVHANAGQLHAELDAVKDHRELLLRAAPPPFAPRAQARLCYRYAFGKGVPQNYREAKIWCDRAAHQGDAGAQYMLGLMYNKGQGVPEDFFWSYVWLDLAAAQTLGGKRDFFYRIRDSVATKLTPSQLDGAQRAALDWSPILEQRTIYNRRHFRRVLTIAK